MTTLGLYFRGMTQQEANALRTRLNALAAGLGYTASSGPTKGDGNLAALLVGIDKQEVAIIKLDDEGHHKRLMDWLRWNPNAGLYAFGLSILGDALDNCDDD